MSVEEVFTENREHFSAVPDVASDWVCNICLGPCNPRFGRLCRGCEMLFDRRHAPALLRDRIVPMTSVVERGPWYHALLNYKRGMPDEYMPVLASLMVTYLDEHEDDIERLLGGTPTVVAIVPSKRGDTFETQPLRRVVRAALRLRDWADLLGYTLQFAGDPDRDHRQRYFPDEFEAGPVEVNGERVLVIEDGWASGATAVSAAGAILGYGATSVAIIPAARIVSHDFWPPTHPYREAMDRTPYDPARWPR